MQKLTGVSAVIADGQPLIVAGLKDVLNDKLGVSVTGIAGKGKHMVDLVEQFQPTLLIADYNVPGYISLDDIRNAMSGSENTRVLILSSDNNKASILDTLQLGVTGYNERMQSR